MQALLFERGKATCFALGVERVVDLGDVLRLASTKPKNEPTHVACTYFPVARGEPLATCFNCSSTVEASLIRQAASKVRLTFIQTLQAARQIVPPFFAPRRVRTCGQKWELGRLHADVEILAIRWDEASMPAYHVPEIRPMIGANPEARQMVDSSSVFRAEIVSCSPRAVISDSVGSTKRAFIARPRTRFILHTWSGCQPAAVHGSGRQGQARARRLPQISLREVDAGKGVSTDKPGQDAEWTQEDLSMALFTLLPPQTSAIIFDVRVVLLYLKEADLG